MDSINHVEYVVAADCLDILVVNCRHSFDRVLLANTSNAVCTTFRILIAAMNSFHVEDVLLACSIAFNPCICQVSCSSIGRQSCSYILQPQQRSSRIF